MAKASDDYWETRGMLEDVKFACESEALLADPCKDLFEESSRLAREILDNIDNGFDGEKATKREEVKLYHTKLIAIQTLIIHLFVKLTNATKLIQVLATNSKSMNY